jgi:formate dehydrogenase
MRNEDTPWHATACCLCYANCGVKVQLDPEGRSIVRVRGDRDHPASKGYTCNKALHLDAYQNGRDRLDTPLRRRADGSFEPIDWDTAIREIAAKLGGIRDEHGGTSILYYGGGGQGNHLGGGYNGAVQQALGMRYRSNALAQEKTGLAWVSQRTVGGFWHGDFEHCDVALIVGKNPWQSNGMQRARIHMKEISRAPDRLLVVFDPRRTETAELADVHMAVRPGTDAWCLAAILGQLVQSGGANLAWLDEHANGHAEVLDALARVPVAAFAAFAGVSLADVERVAAAMAKSERIAVYEDLGVEMAPNSTLVSWLNVLLFLVRGSFARSGGTNLVTGLGSLFAFNAGAGRLDEDGIEQGYATSPVTGARIICGLLPCNSIPDEILTDHPKRFRAAIVESANPVHSLADAPRMREAFAALECVVVIDVAMTETARAAHYVLPASSQYEKYEATFFNFEYPDNFFHLRRPLFAPRPGTLPEAEIHARLVEALGVFEPGELDGLAAAAKAGREQYAGALFMAMQTNRKIGAYVPYVLYRTLGPVLAPTGGTPGDAAVAAAVFGLVHVHAMKHADAVRAAGHEGEGLALGNALFGALLDNASGVLTSREDPDAATRQFRMPSGKVEVAMQEMLQDFARLTDYDLPSRTDEFPLVLAAGERRAYTANTIIRDPQWRRSNNPTALTVNPVDANALGLTDNATARLVTKRAAVEVLVQFDDAMQPGTISLPNGLGLSYPDANGREVVTGVSTNELTSTEDRDRWAGTPWHKHVRARLEKVG